jgi:hypothetical protein
MRRRHADVDDGQVGLVLGDELAQLATVSCLADDLVSRSFEQGSTVISTA